MSIVDYQDLLTELKRAFTALNEKLSKGTLSVPEFRVTKRGNRRNLSWLEIDNLQGGRKIPNFCLSRELLQCSSYELLKEIVKLMVHYSNDLEGNRDVSVEGYHNKYFKRKAEEFGFIVTSSKYYGYSEVEAGDLLTKVINEVNFNESLLPKHKTEEKKVEDNKYDTLTIQKGTKSMLKTFCKLTGMTMLEVTERAFEKYMAEYKK